MGATEFADALTRVPLLMIIKLPLVEFLPTGGATECLFTHVFTHFMGFQSRCGIKLFVTLRAVELMQVVSSVNAFVNFQVHCMLESLFTVGTAELFQV